LADCGCSNQAAAPASQGIAVHKDPSEILILYTRTVGRTNQVVGDVEVDAQDADTSLAALRQKAADMGADAVVGVQSDGAHLSGTAVRYR